MYRLLLLLSVFPNLLLANSIDENWLKIMHYENGYFSYKNRVTSKSFFFSENGANDPQTEFESQLAFYSKANHNEEDKVIRCKYPMRTRYFEKILSKKYPISHCDKYLEWRKLVDFKTLQFVYASSFPNNPASMFGHTLLVMSKGDTKPTLESVSISYMAHPEEEDSAPVYMFKGLTGGYNGYYEITHFYDILKLYQKQEDRNLWYFSLNYNEEQKQDLLALLWEAKNSLYKPYLFFDKNCSYELLSLLYGAGIIEDIRGDFGIFTMPLETYKKVANEYTKGAEEKVLISNLNNIERQIKKMPELQRDRLYASLSDPEIAKKDPKLLDMNIQIQHRKVIKNGLWMKQDFVTLSDLLVERSKLASISKIDREYNQSALNEVSPLYSNSIHRAS